MENFLSDRQERYEYFLSHIKDESFSPLFKHNDRWISIDYCIVKIGKRYNLIELQTGKSLRWYKLFKSAKDNLIELQSRKVSWINSKTLIDLNGNLNPILLL